MSSKPGGWIRSLRGGVALFLLGVIGVAVAAVENVPVVRALPGFESASFPLLVVLAAANSVILLGVFVLLGTATAPRVGLRSHVYAWASGEPPEWDALRDSLGLAVGLGIALFVVIAVLDVAFASFVRLEVPPLVGEEALRSLSIPMRVLYGGITEELLLRWGVMAPSAWMLWRLRGVVGSAPRRPSDATMWAAIVLSATLFGIGHLPALAASYTLTTPLIVRTVVLNAVGGIGFGWLFWKHSLESGMVAHAAFHATLVAVSVALTFLV